MTHGARGLTRAAQRPRLRNSPLRKSGLGEVAHAGQAFKADVLRPQFGAVVASGGVDQAVGQWQPLTAASSAIGRSLLITLSRYISDSAAAAMSSPASRTSVLTTS